jgi:hypothetical protein
LYCAIVLVVIMFYRVLMLPIHKPAVVLPTTRHLPASVKPGALYFREVEFECPHPEAWDDPRILTVTALRHPVDRILSQFYYEAKPWARFVEPFCEDCKRHGAKCTYLDCLERRPELANNAFEAIKNNTELWEKLITEWLDTSREYHCNNYAKRFGARTCCDASSRKQKKCPSPAAPGWSIFNVSCYDCHRHHSCDVPEFALASAIERLRKTDVLLLTEKMNNPRSAELLAAGLASLNPPTATTKIDLGKKHNSRSKARRREDLAPPSVLRRLEADNYVDVQIYEAAVTIVQKRFDNPPKHFPRNVKDAGLVYFLHMRKAGGTSLGKVLRDWFESQGCCYVCDYGEKRCNYRGPEPVCGHPPTWYHSKVGKWGCTGIY